MNLDILKKKLMLSTVSQYHTHLAWPFRASVVNIKIHYLNNYMISSFLLND